MKTLKTTETQLIYILTMTSSKIEELETRIDNIERRSDWDKYKSM